MNTAMRQTPAPRRWSPAEAFILGQACGTLLLTSILSSRGWMGMCCSISRMCHIAWSLVQGVHISAARRVQRGGPFPVLPSLTAVPCALWPGERALGWHSRAGCHRPQARTGGSYRGFGGCAAARQGALAAPPACCPADCQLVWHAPGWRRQAGCPCLQARTEGLCRGCGARAAAGQGHLAALPGCCSGSHQPSHPAPGCR